jgi:hypothetical protein
MNTQHTPGPWEVRKGEPWVIAKAYGDMKSVVHLNLPVDQSESQKADARLIAAAPDLLEALQYMANVCPAIDSTGDDAHIKARAAIAKATGVQHE